MNRSESLSFLQALWPADAPGSIVVWTQGQSRKRSGIAWCTSVDQAVEVAGRYREVRNVYFGLARQDPERALAAARRKRPGAELAGVRGAAESATAIPGLWIDVDVRAGVHARGDLPPDREAARGLLAVAPEPSVVVDSGYGLHAYWLFDAPWILATDDDRRRAASFVRSFQAAIRAAAAERGWNVDPTADLARVLRLPGSLNHKGQPPRPVRLELLNPERRYALAQLSVGQAEPADSHVGRALPADSEKPIVRRSLTYPEDPPDIDAIARECAWLAHCYADRARLSEPEWYAALSIVARAGDRELVHAWSRGHPGYDPAETDRKAQRALRDAGPRTCTYVAAELGAGEAYCRRCRHWGRVKSPIVLGRRRTDERVEVRLGNDEKRVNDEALAALARHPDLYHRGNVLVQIVAAGGIGDEEGPRIVRVQEATLREMLAERVDFRRVFTTREGDDATRPVPPPQPCTRALLARGHWPRLRRLAGVTECPVLRSDGSVVQTPGYDRATGLVYEPNARYPAVPQQPSDGEVEGALNALRDVVVDFPFRGQAHFAAWLAALLTPLARPAFSGPSPCFLIDANVRGSGKSLLVSVTSLIATGREVARMAYSASREEQEKAVLSIALGGLPVVLIDNVSGLFGSPVLEAALTSTRWSGRLLGQSAMASAPLATVWYVTGNNVTVAGDMDRRCLLVRLESPAENPERRDGFRRPRLLEWLSTERGRLTAAALTLLRAYGVSGGGKASAGLEAWGSYESWSAWIRGCVTWLGLPDPVRTCGEVASEAGSDAAVLSIFISGLAELLGELPGGCGTVRDVLGELARPERRTWYGRLREAVGELVPDLAVGQSPNAAQLGTLLREVRGRVVGGRRVERARKTRSGVLWRVLGDVTV